MSLEQGAHGPSPNEQGILHGIAELPKNEFLIKQGLEYRTTLPSSILLFQVTAGMIGLMKHHKSGRDLIEEVFHPGEIFGYEWFEAKSYPVSIFALQESEIRVGEVTFRSLSAEMKQKVFRAMVERNTKQDDLRRVTVFGSLESRLADTLFEFQDKKGFVTVSQKGMALKAGGAQENVAKHLKKLKRRRIIYAKRHSTGLSIADAARLERVRNKERLIRDF